MIQFADRSRMQKFRKIPTEYTEYCLRFRIAKSAIEFNYGWITGINHKSYK